MKARYAEWIEGEKKADILGFALFGIIIRIHFIFQNTVKMIIWYTS